MIDSEKIKYLADNFSPQEMFSALVWQRNFNNFNGQRVIKDLAANARK